MSHTFGWIQNPGSLETLKKVVGAFVKDSDSNKWLLEKNLPLLKCNNFITGDNYSKFVEILSKDNIVVPYSIAKGKGAGSGSSRKDALCSGIVQAVIHAQKKVQIKNLSGRKIEAYKPYTDDWTAEGYLRWAIATGVIDYNRNNDSCTVSELGKKLVDTRDGTKEEQEIFAAMLLSYPPVYRILTILSDQNLHTKFEMGSKLGFKGELGFTSIPQNVYLYDYCSAETTAERAEVRSNLEGDADKYARMIANWLVSVGWAETERKSVTECYLGKTYTTELQAWRITRDGEKAIKRSDGNSSNKRISKIVMYEMLASNKTSDSEYLRFRRANILKCIKTASTAEKIQADLKKISLDETVETILDDIANFENIGLRIAENHGRYKLTDDIVGLEIPTHDDGRSKGDIVLLKEKIRTRLRHIDHKYLILVDLAYSNASTKAKKNLDAKEFEIETANLFSDEIGYRAERLGDSNRPDVLLEFDSHGAIIDNKSYKDGLNISVGLRDEMSRYIDENNNRQPNIPPNEWWKWFSAGTENYAFLYVTSFLTGRFENQLKYIYELRKIHGAAISVENLLYIAEAIKGGTITKNDFFGMFNDGEIVYDIAVN